MKILITGGSGFIGTNLIEYLQKKGKYTLLSIDKNQPRIDIHHSIYNQVDICNKEVLNKVILLSFFFL